MHMQAIVAETKPSRLVLSLLGCASVLLLICVTMRIMNFEIRRDEFLYVPVARLLDSHRLYLDFFYNHPPGSAWFFYGLGKITGLNHLLLIGRLGELLAWVLFAASIMLVSLALTRSSIASWCITVLSLTNALFLSQTGMTATNNFLPLPFSYLGIGLFILELRNPAPRPIFIALAGLCLSIAVSLKLNAVAFILPVALAALFLPSSISLGQRLKVVVLPLLIGGLVGGAPILYYLLTDPALFLAHVVSYHLGPHAEYFRTVGSLDGDSVMSLPEKVFEAFRIWTASAIAVAIASLLALVLFQRMPWRRLIASPLRNLGPAVGIVIGAALLSIALSILPTPSYPQYFAPPLICIPLALALAFVGLPPAMRLPAQNLLVASALTVLVISAPQLLQHLGSTPKVSKWTVERVHRSGMSLASRLAQEGVAGKVATLSPIYPLEGGLDVYLELATGPFAYRTGDITSPELARFYRMTSPQHVGALLESDPPAALLLGFEPELEAPLTAYAESHGYVRLSDFEIKDRYGAGGLYIRPRP